MAVEEEIQQTRNVSDVQDVSVSHQLQEQLQQANETMEKLLHQPKPSQQSQSKTLFVASPSAECVNT